jgi:hypothetical protein
VELARLLRAMWQEKGAKTSSYVDDEATLRLEPPKNLV